MTRLSRWIEHCSWQVLRRSR